MLNLRSTTRRSSERRKCASTAPSPPTHNDMVIRCVIRPDSAMSWSAAEAACPT
ncbi:hypothetical protein ACFQ0B_53930 [Nonomuraea thailandensis]